MKSLAMVRSFTLAACVLLAAATPGFAQETCAPAEAAPAPSPGGDELRGLPAEARLALDAGRVVLLETVNEKKVLASKLVAVVDARPADIIDTLRDYDAMAAYPEVRKLTASKGEDRDTFELTVKPHPLLPPMDFRKAVEWSLDGEGSAYLGMSLLSTSSDYIADQQADYRILPLDEQRSLVFYETRSTYAKLSFRERVLRRSQESAQRWLSDLQGRAAARGDDESRGGGALALLSTAGTVAAPLR